MLLEECHVSECRNWWGVVTPILTSMWHVLGRVWGYSSLLCYELCRTELLLVPSEEVPLPHPLDQMIPCYLDG